MRAERRAEQELQKEGWLTYRVKGSTKFNKRVDMFGLFDIFALSIFIETIDDEWQFDDTTPRRKYVQIKCNSKPNLKPYKEFKEYYCDENDSVEIWIWYDRKGWKKIIV